MSLSLVYVKNSHRSRYPNRLGNVIFNSDDVSSSVQVSIYHRDLHGKEIEEYLLSLPISTVFIFQKYEHTFDDKEHIKVISTSTGTLNNNFVDFNINYISGSIKDRVVNIDAYLYINSASGALVPHNLNSHTDVTILAPQLDEILQYNDVSGQWENKPFPVVLDKKRGWEYIYRTGSGDPASGEFTYANPLFKISKTDNQGILRDFRLVPSFYSRFVFDDNNPSTNKHFSIDRGNSPVTDSGSFWTFNVGTSTPTGLVDLDVLYLTITENGVTQLNQLVDTSLTGIDQPNDQEVLTFDSGSGLWKAEPVPAGATQLNDLSDVTVTAPAGGQILQYNPFTTQFENVALPASEDNRGPWLHIDFDFNTPFPPTVDGYWGLSPNLIAPTKIFLPKKPVGGLSDETLLNPPVGSICQIHERDVGSSTQYLHFEITNAGAVGATYREFDITVIAIGGGGPAGSTSAFHISRWGPASGGGVAERMVGHPFQWTNTVPPPSGTIYLNGSTIYISTTDSDGNDLSGIMDLGVVGIGTRKNTFLKWFSGEDSNQFYMYCKIPSDLTLTTGTPDYYTGSVFGLASGVVPVGTDGNLIIQIPELESLADIPSKIITHLDDVDNTFGLGDMYFLGYDGNIGKWNGIPNSRITVYFRNNTTATTITTQKTVVNDNSNFFPMQGNVNTITGSNLEFITFGIGNNVSYVGIKSRRFVVTAKLSAVAGSNDRVCYFTIVRNNNVYDDIISVQNLHADRVETFVLTTDVELSTNDTVQVYCANTENTDSITVQFFQMTIVGI